MEETRVSSAFSFHINSKVGLPWMLMDGIEPPSPRWNGNNCGALPLSDISIIQKCLHPLIVFEFCYFFASLYYITACGKKYYAITKEELSSPIIVKFAVIKLRGGFKPHFCHTRPVVCPSWFSASNVTRLHCYITMLMYGWRGRPPWWPPFFLIIVITRISGTAPASD